MGVHFRKSLKFAGKVYRVLEVQMVFLAGWMGALDVVEECVECNVRILKIEILLLYCIFSRFNGVGKRVFVFLLDIFWWSVILVYIVHMIRYENLDRFWIVVVKVCSNDNLFNLIYVFHFILLLLWTLYL